MRNAENHKLEMIAYEAFLRRASIINMPFMLKGSYVTRQYFPDGVNRFPADMDWVYMHHLKKEDEAESIFSRWVTEITELEVNDGIVFRSFTENKFWRLMDYAMADDFPTVNTDLNCTIHGYELILNIDISFNLSIEQLPIPLNYKPIEGEAFTVPFTVPLSLQVSWKIHQTLVRPRFKDLFDLTYLVIHSAFDADIRAAALQALVNECEEDNIGHENLVHFLNYEFEKIYPTGSVNTAWGFWRHGVRTTEAYKFALWGEEAENITDIDNIPPQLTHFLQNLKNNLEVAGLKPALLKQLPIADYISRSMANIDIEQDREANKQLEHQTTGGNKTVLNDFLTCLFKRK